MVNEGQWGTDNDKEGPYDLVMTEGGTDKDKDGQTKKEGRYDLVMTGDLKSEIIIYHFSWLTSDIPYLKNYMEYDFLNFSMWCVHIAHITSYNIILTKFWQTTKRDRQGQRGLQ